MSTWTSLLSRSAALLNDQDRANYTDTVLLPYLNIALGELQEIFELNNIPVTNKTSGTLTVPSATSLIGFTTTPPLPADLVEIQELFESATGQNTWIRVDKREFLTDSLLTGSTQISTFGVWAWIDQQIQVRPAIVSIDLKLDYIKTIFVEQVLSSLSSQNTILNTDTFFIYNVAGLAAEYIDENLTRADKLYQRAGMALDRSLGISVKGKQSIAVRRRPFRAAWKRRRTLL